MEDAFKKIKQDFKNVVDLITSTMGQGYAVKNPGLVQHMLGLIQQEKDREVNKELNNLNRS